MPPEMGTIHRSPRARADLVSIGDDVAERMKSLASANRVLEAIEQKLKLLARHPLSGQARPDLQTGVHCFPVGKYDYVIFYRPQDNGIELLRVLHSSRDVPRIFRSGEN